MSTLDLDPTVVLAEGTILGRSHDPSTGEESVTVTPEDAPDAEKVRELIRSEAKKRGEAVEVVYTKGAAHWRSLPKSPAVTFALLARGRVDGTLDDAEVVRRTSIKLLKQVLAPQISTSPRPDPICRGLGVNIGAATGFVAQSAAEVVTLGAQGRAAILFVEMTKPEDLGAMQVAVAIITMTGGPASHASIVSTQMGRPCIVNTGAVGLESGQEITMDAATGEIFADKLALTEPNVDGAVHAVLSCADRVTKLQVMANADTAVDASKARLFGARGIGLMRTEHMFFSDQSHQDAMLGWILAKNKPSARATALERIRSHQQADFSAVFKAMRGFPVTVRLMDPPLSEFLPDPDNKDAIKHAAEVTKASQQWVRDRIHELRETNPMLGHRGCRLGVTNPELYRAQVNAAARAAWDMIGVYQSGNTISKLGIMLPLVASKREAVWLVNQLRTELAEVGANYMKETKKKLPIEFGVMLETPRACLDVQGLAESADFFSFGTNDLTQMTWALSRDDAASFLPKYAAADIMGTDPFVTLDREGVGALMEHAVGSLSEEARATKSFAICGEHGGDPASIAYCVELGLDYVSCSPYRIPIARLAAARASIGAGVDDATDGDDQLFLLPADSELLAVAKSKKGKKPKDAKADPAAKYDAPTQAKLKLLVVSTKDEGWWKAIGHAEHVAKTFSGWRVLLKEHPAGADNTSGYVVGWAGAYVVLGFIGATGGYRRGDFAWTATADGLPARDWLDPAVYGGYLKLPVGYLAGIQPAELAVPPEFTEPSTASIAPPILGATPGAKVTGAPPPASSKGAVTAVDDSSTDDAVSSASPKPAPAEDGPDAAAMAATCGGLYVKVKSAPDPKKPIAKLVGYTDDHSFVVVAFGGGDKPWVKPDSFPAYTLVSEVPPSAALWIFLPDEVKLATHDAMVAAGLVVPTPTPAPPELAPPKTVGAAVEAAIAVVQAAAASDKIEAAVIDTLAAISSPHPPTPAFEAFLPSGADAYKTFATTHAGKCVALKVSPKQVLHGRVVGYAKSTICMQLAPGDKWPGHSGMGAPIHFTWGPVGSVVTSEHKDFWYMGANQYYAICGEH